MTILNKFRYYCNTEAAQVTEWREESEGPPVTCKNDPAHAINTNSITVTETVKEQQVVISPAVGDRNTLIDGVFLSAAENEWKVADYILSEEAHIEGAICQWSGFQLGDKVLVLVGHPISLTNPIQPAVQGSNQIEVAAAIAPFYNPLNGAKYAELRSNNQLKEVREIDSVAGPIITLKSNLINSYTTADQLRVLYNKFTPFIGAGGIDGGIKLFESGNFLFRNGIEITNSIAAGLTIVVWLGTTVDAGLRKVGVNFIMRSTLQ